MNDSDSGAMLIVMVMMIADILGHLYVPGSVLSPCYAIKHFTQEVFELDTTLSCFTDEHLRITLEAETQIIT